MSAPSQPILFPLVGKVLCDYMNGAAPQALLATVPDQNDNTVPTCPVASAVPSTRPSRFIALYTAPTAGPQRRILSVRRIICQIYEGSEFVTGQLAETARGLIVDSKYQRLGIKSVNVIGEPARFPGPSVPWRWQFTADVMVRAIAGPWS
jgi:hypothetical protein